MIATAVAACGSSTTTPQASSETSSQPPAPTGSASPSVSGALAAVADVPVGSGVIVGDVVITQATAGDFKGFSSVCTHAGCNVSKITDGKIVCPCHNSEFNLDGTVAQGPAKKPLEAKAVSVQGNSIVTG
ncbi:Rieske iron-sulfur protein [Mycobacterium antarcticum]|nr:Rieske iron-sulfur protein [Mycolicibacterium sp. TUM20985]GLP84440.1 Rieske iron-sulfur protein [Mycolicibacterium sp. TUM20984]